MRTLRDMNLSKLVFEDVELFSTLISDIFPGKTSDRVVYPKLSPAIQRVIQMHKLVPHEQWVSKIIQLYETKLVLSSIYPFLRLNGATFACGDGRSITLHICKAQCLMFFSSTKQQHACNVSFQVENDHEGWGSVCAMQVYK